MPNAERPNAEPVLDKQAALARMGGDIEILQLLAQAFLEDAPAIVDQLGNEIVAQQAVGVHHQAHKIKGLASNFDAHLVCRIAAELESLGRSAQLEKAAKLFENLKTEVVRLESAIHAEIL